MTQSNKFDIFEVLFNALKLVWNWLILIATVGIVDNFTELSVPWATLLTAKAIIPICISIIAVAVLEASPFFKKQTKPMQLGYLSALFIALLLILYAYIYLIG